MNSVESNPIQSTVLQCTLYSQPCNPVYCAEYTHRSRGLAGRMAECTGSTLLYRVYSPSQTTTVYTAQHCTAESIRQLFNCAAHRRSRHCTALDCTGCYYYGCTSCTMFFLRGELSFYSSCTEQHCTAHSTATAVP
jgi:hypothetical protein